MTALLERDRSWYDAGERGKRNRREELVHIARQARKLDGVGIVQQMAVLLHGRATARRVHHDRVKAALQKRAQIPPSQVARDDLLTAMDIQRATAHLLPRDVNFAAIAPQNTHGRPVDWPVYEWHHAAGEQANAITRRPLGRVYLPARRKRRRQLW